MKDLAYEAASILGDLEASGVAVAMDGSDLILKPCNRLSADLLDRVKASKDAVVRLVIHRRLLDVVRTWREDWQEYFLERSGMIGDGTSPRDVADEIAFHLLIAHILADHGIDFQPLSIPSAKLLWVKPSADPARGQFFTKATIEDLLNVIGWQGTSAL
jgi:hypothetical protein